jgi:hypothetical protein
MLFTLEALRAKHGDSLLLHFGDEKSPRLIVIDGGPSGVYASSLRPRLQQLQQARQNLTGEARLPVSLAMVSHIDDDHINGFLAWIEALGKPGSPSCDVLELWHNSFDDIIGSEAEANALLTSMKPAVIAALNSAGSTSGLHAALVLASVPQGRNLRVEAKKQGLTVNGGFPSGIIAVRDAQKAEKHKFGTLTLTVLGPGLDRVRDFQTKWKAQLKKMGVAKTAALDDQSIFNLSSIIVLAETGGKSMLLTGDARGDDIMAGLKQAKLFKNDVFKCDVLKIPHHGSDHNTSTEFFRRVVADHYVFSGNGKYGNPELSTLEMLLNARPGEAFAMHFTYPEDRLKKFFASKKPTAKVVTVDYLADSTLGLKVNLGSPLGF